MPARSEKQRRFAAMSRSPAGRRRLRAIGKDPMPPDVAQDFARKVAGAFGERRRGRG